MPSFDSLARWERYEPALGNNLELPPAERFYLRVSAGLTIEEYRAVIDGLAQPGDSEAVAARLAGVVEMGSEPLAVNGQPVDTLAKYLDLAARQRGQDLLGELVGVLSHFNSMEGSAELFSGRRSGGASGTRPAPKATAARPGSATSPSRGPTPPRASPAKASAAGAPPSTSAAESPSTPGSEAASTSEK